MFTVEWTNQFKRDLKLAKRQKKDLDALRIVMDLIQLEKPLPQKLRDHALSGNWDGYRELHVEPDWLLIYKFVPKRNAVIFVRIGSHSELFK